MEAMKRNRLHQAAGVVINAIYVALAVALGGPEALYAADQSLRQAIADGAVDDPAAIAVTDTAKHSETSTAGFSCGKCILERTR